MDLPDAISSCLWDSQILFHLWRRPSNVIPTSVDVAAGLPDYLYLSCNLRERGEGTGVLVKVGATLDSCMSPVAQISDGIQLHFSASTNAAVSKRVIHMHSILPAWLYKLNW
jgi:hypothetical protein